MSAPIFQLAVASATVKALLGTSPTRFYLFGEADQSTVKPYAVWQQIYGSPENKLAGTPDEDVFGVMVDVYGNSASEVRQIGVALRDAFEPHGYVMSWGNESRELDTRLYRFSFTVEFMVSR